MLNNSTRLAAHGKISSLNYSIEIDESLLVLYVVGME